MGCRKMLEGGGAWLKDSEQKVNMGMSGEKWDGERRGASNAHKKFNSALSQPQHSHTVVCQMEG